MSQSPSPWLGHGPGHVLCPSLKLVREKGVGECGDIMLSAFKPRLRNGTHSCHSLPGGELSPGHIQWEGEAEKRPF